MIDPPAPDMCGGDLGEGVLCVCVREGARVGSSWIFFANFRFSHHPRFFLHKVAGYTGICQFAVDMENGVLTLRLPRYIYNISTQNTGVCQ